MSREQKGKTLDDTVALFKRFGVDVQIDRDLFLSMPDPPFSDYMHEMHKLLPTILCIPERKTYS